MNLFKILLRRKRVEQQSEQIHETPELHGTLLPTDTAPAKEPEAPKETTKLCSKCKQEKPVSQFYKSKTSKDGYTYWCKEDMNKNRKNWKESKESKEVDNE
jgi:hypothetical protein